MAGKGYILGMSIKKDSSLFIKLPYIIGTLFGQ